MSALLNIGGTYKDIVQIRPKVNIGGVWKTVTKIAGNIDGVWKTAWENLGYFYVVAQTAERIKRFNQYGAILMTYFANVGIGWVIFRPTHNDALFGRSYNDGESQDKIYRLLSTGGSSSWDANVQISNTNGVGVSTTGKLYISDYNDELRSKGPDSFSGANWVLYDYNFEWGAWQGRTDTTKLYCIAYDRTTTQTYQVHRRTESTGVLESVILTISGTPGGMCLDKNDNIYLVTTLGIYKYSKTGSLIWSSTAKVGYAGYHYNTIRVDEYDRLFFSSLNNYNTVYRLSQTDGSILWTSTPFSSIPGISLSTWSFGMHNEFIGMSASDYGTIDIEYVALVDKDTGATVTAVQITEDEDRGTGGGNNSISGEGDYAYLVN